MAPATPNPLGHQRDRDVRRAGRVRAALVGGAAAASVGIAGVLGVTALSAPSSASAATHGSAHRGTASKSGLVADLHSFGSGQPVTNGSSNGGVTHATTKGS